MSAIEATTSACRLAFRFLPPNAPNVLRPEVVSSSSVFKINSAAAFAVFNAISSLPPAIRIDRAATIAVVVALEISSASAVFGFIGGPPKL